MSYYFEGAYFIWDSGLHMGCIFASMSQLGVILSSNKHANRSRSLQHHHPHQNHLRRHQLASYFSCGSLSSWQQHLLQWISHLHSCETRLMTDKKMSPVRRMGIMDDLELSD